MSTPITVIAWIMSAWLVIGSLRSVTQIGQPREPITAGIAIGSIVISLVVAWILVGAR